MQTYFCRTFSKVNTRTSQTLFPVFGSPDFAFLGDWGPWPPSSFRSVISRSMLVSPKTTTQSIIFKQPKPTHTKGQTMHIPKFKFNFYSRPLFYSASYAFCASLLLANAIGCSTSVQKRDSIASVLSSQNELMVRLQAERAIPAISQKVQNDRDLSNAEMHLNEAINALKESNKIVQESLK